MFFFQYTFENQKEQKVVILAFFVIRNVVIFVIFIYKQIMINECFKLQNPYFFIDKDDIYNVGDR